MRTMFPDVLAGHVREVGRLFGAGHADRIAANMGIDDWRG